MLIGEVSKQSRISARMLRHDDKIGLVSPTGRSPDPLPTKEIGQIAERFRAWLTGWARAAVADHEAEGRVLHRSADHRPDPPDQRLGRRVLPRRTGTGPVPRPPGPAGGNEPEPCGRTGHDRARERMERLPRQRDPAHRTHPDRQHRHVTRN